MKLKTHHIRINKLNLIALSLSLLLGSIQLHAEAIPPFKTLLKEIDKELNGAKLKPSLSVSQNTKDALKYIIKKADRFPRVKLLYDAAEHLNNLIEKLEVKAGNLDKETMTNSWVVIGKEKDEIAKKIFILSGDREAQKLYLAVVDLLSLTTSVKLGQEAKIENLMAELNTIKSSGKYSDELASLKSDIEALNGGALPLEKFYKKWNPENESLDDGQRTRYRTYWELAKIDTPELVEFGKEKSKKVSGAPEAGAP